MMIGKYFAYFLLAVGLATVTGCVVEDEGPLEEAGEAVDDAVDDAADSVDDTF